MSFFKDAASSLRQIALTGRLETTGMSSRHEFCVYKPREGAVKARRLIGSAAYGPDVLKVLFEAFDTAWARIAPACGNDPQVIASKRTQLANIILALAKDRPKPDAQELRDSALRILGQTADD
jgi:hypothetical protein